VAAYFGIAQQRSSLQSIYQERIPAMKNAADIDRRLAGIQTSTYKLLAMMDANFPADKVQAAAAAIRADLDTVQDLLQRAAKAPGMGAEEKGKFENAARSVSDYRKAVGEVIDIAGVQVAMATAFMSKAQNKYDDLAVQLKTLREIEDAQVNEAYRSAELIAGRATVIVLVALVLSVALSVTVALYVAANIVRSVAAIRAATSKLSEGDLGQQAANGNSGALEHEAEVHRKDEIGTLARSFSSMVSYLKEMAAVSESIAGGDLSNQVEPRSEHDALGNAFIRMTEGLRVLVCSVRDSAAQVASASAQVANASEESARIGAQSSSAIDEITSTMHEMKINVQNVVKNTQMQAASVSDTSGSISEMVASIQRVAENTKVLLDISNRSRGEVQSGIASMEKAADGLNRINGAINSSAEIIGALGQRADDIGKIIEVIDDMAEQTNLLALNAAIEAARAGEHGLGFAVVADEVRKLAEKSAQSTKEISELIQSIQKEARRAVENMQTSTSIVNDGLTLGADLNAALKRIADVVTEVHKFAQEIGAATSEQSHGSSQIAKAATRLNEITDEINSAVEEQASGTQAVAKAMERMREMVQQSASSSTELAASAEQMSKMSRSLVQLMGRFKLEAGEKTNQEAPRQRLAASAASARS
jgi:methyl-accepting chemotaxis protein